MNVSGNRSFLASKGSIGGNTKENAFQLSVVARLGSSMQFEIMSLYLVRTNKSVFRIVKIINHKLIIVLLNLLYNVNNFYCVVCSN